MTSWLEDASSQALQQSLKNLEDAWGRHFKSLKELKARKIKASQVLGPPQFKKKGQHDKFSLSARIRTRSAKQQSVPTEAWLGSLPQQPGGPRVR